MLVRKEATKTSVLVFAICYLLFAVPDPRTGHSGLMEPRYVARQEEMRGVRSNASVNEGVVTRIVRVEGCGVLRRWCCVALPCHSCVALSGSVAAQMTNAVWSTLVLYEVHRSCRAKSE